MSREFFLIFFLPSSKEKIKQQRKGKVSLVEIGKAVKKGSRPQASLISEAGPEKSSPPHPLSMYSIGSERAFPGFQLRVSSTTRDTP